MACMQMSTLRRKSRLPLVLMMRQARRLPLSSRSSSPRRSLCFSFACNTCIGSLVHGTCTCSLDGTQSCSRFQTCACLAVCYTAGASKDMCTVVAAPPVRPGGHCKTICMASTDHTSKPLGCLRPAQGDLLPTQPTLAICPTASAAW